MNSMVKPPREKPPKEKECRSPKTALPQIARLNSVFKDKDPLDEHCLITQKKKTPAGKKMATVAKARIILLLDNPEAANEACRAFNEDSDGYNPRHDAFIKYYAEIATSCAMTLLICRENWVNIIISDFKLPGMNGLELLRTLKQRNKEAKVIIINNGITYEDRYQLIKEGVSKIIDEPWDSKKLRKAVEEII